MKIKFEEKYRNNTWKQKYKYIVECIIPNTYFWIVSTNLFKLENNIIPSTIAPVRIIGKISCFVKTVVEPLKLQVILTLSRISCCYCNNSFSWDTYYLDSGPISRLLEIKMIDFVFLGLPKRPPQKYGFDIFIACFQ